jgi:hypothetical protein
MRVGLLLSGLALLFPASAPAQPETVLYTATVTQAEAAVRCLPKDSPEAYPTNSLPVRTQVQVVEEKGDGWLGIIPPEGSYSWINQRFVRQLSPNQPTYVVTAAANVAVGVLVGSAVNGNNKPNKEGARLYRGAQVVRVGDPVVDSDGTWLRIQPPVGELRYIRAEAVTRNNGPVQPAQPSPSPFNPARPDPTLAGGPSPGGTTPQPPLNIPGNTGPVAATGSAAERARIEALYNQAVQADRAGNVAQAISLYTQVGTEGVVIQQDLAMKSLNRAYALRQPGRGQSVQGQPPRTGSLPGTLPEHPSQFTPSGTNPPPNPYPDPNVGAANLVARPNGGFAYRTGPGTFRLASQRILEGRQTYLMVTRDNRPIAYVTAEPGVDLVPYIGREVELFGRAAYDGNLRMNLMAVERVEPVGR